jgi:hypothetical protein
MTSIITEHIRMKVIDRAGRFVRQHTQGYRRASARRILDACKEGR